jgi:hypothetical protein
VGGAVVPSEGWRLEWTTVTACLLRTGAAQLRSKVVWCMLAAEQALLGTTGCAAATASGAAQSAPACGKDLITQELSADSAFITQDGFPEAGARCICMCLQVRTQVAACKVHRHAGSHAEWLCLIHLQQPCLL